jgi:hypothetical protein
MPQVRAHGRVVVAHLLACASLLIWSTSLASAQERRPWVDPAPTQAAPPTTPPASTEVVAPVPPAQPLAVLVDPTPSATRPTDAALEVKPKVARPNAPRRDAVQVRLRVASTQTRRTSTSSSPKVTQAPRIDRQAEPASQQRTRTATLRPLPSFNCSYAQTLVEQVICAEPGLAAKDLRMALLYEQRGGSRYRPVDAQQWRWLAGREACGRAPRAVIERCIAQSYDARIAELSGGRW